MPAILLKFQDSVLLKVLSWAPTNVTEEECTFDEHPLGRLCRILSEDTKFREERDTLAVFERLLKFYKKHSGCKFDGKQSWLIYGCILQIFFSIVFNYSIVPRAEITMGFY